MAYIQFYADEKDFRTIHQYLSEHPDIAFIVPNGRGRWCAVREVPRLKGTCVGLDGTPICLWHIPSGPLPLLLPPYGLKAKHILDPCAGWKELFQGPTKDCPNFIDDAPGIVVLHRRLRAWEVTGGMGMSSFTWIGGRAGRKTESFWKNLRGWVKEQATLIPRKGRVSGRPREIWAFPSALAAFKTGRGRDYNPW